jgi:RsiW-degrading membrane proteinase PrsW (M82 family)
VKFGAVLGVFIFTTQNDEPIDAMIYCITVALGFAALENTLFILGPLSNGEILKSVVTGNMRFMGATLVHVVSSAVIGFTLGLAFYRGYIAKISAAIVGLAVAIIFHTAFNLSIIANGTVDSLKVFSWVWGAVVILIILFEEIKVVHPQAVNPTDAV